MLEFDEKSQRIVGPKGSLEVLAEDQIARRLAMLIEGECEGLGPTAAARKYGFTKQRYYQLLKAYREGGAAALQPKKRGPKRNYRRTEPAVRQVIRHRFLDPDATAEVVAQQLCQCGYPISVSSVNRVIAEFGLQKKTLRVSSE